MEILDTKRAAERLLNSITPVVPIAYEGVAFNPPNSIYQYVQFVIQPLTDPVLGAGYHRENIELQIFICDVLGKGTSNAISRAELVRSIFKKGLSLTENNTQIHILETPKIHGALPTKDRIVVPIIVPLTVEVYSQ